ncbi:MAG TPA: hypothetical protein VEW28_02490 [Candidatus Kapabacteria bacterium]|nr:hypothetical protein [Candidatus Kapabacteria bacterium]
MKKNIAEYTVAVFISVLTLIYTGCVTTTAPPTTATVTTYSVMDNPNVSVASSGKLKIETAQEGNTCDSIRVTRMRVLVSDMKMHHDESDTLGFGTIKEGAFIASFVADSIQLVSLVSIPPTSYDRVKFEVHRYDPSIDISIGTLADFADFITADHNTVIIEGTVYISGNSYPFVYSSHITINEQEMFQNSFTVESGKSYVVTVVYSPSATFRSSGGQPLDPRDEGNRSAIDASIKTSFKANIRVG